MPFFSVIVPVFNSADTLSRALDSVFAQTFTDYEVIVVDDGSTDQVEVAAQMYLDRVRFLRQKNAGAAAARNQGARLSRGRILAFLDADDLWHPQKLNYQAAVFRDHPEIGVCSCAGRRLRPEALGSLDHLEPHGVAEVKLITDFREVFLSPYFGTPGVAMPRDLFFQLGGFREYLKSAEDIDLWLRAGYVGSVARILTPLFFVIGSRFSLTALHGDGTYLDNLRVIDNFCAEHPEFAQAEGQCVRTVRAKVYEKWGSAALVRRDKTLATKLLKNSLQERKTLRASYLLLKSMLI